MQWRRISSGSAWEKRYGYSRAVVAGEHVHIGGTAPQMPDDADPPTGAYEQARRCLEIVTEALTQAGATPGEVVRTRIFVTHRNHIADVMRAHAETFSEARPACTGMVVELLDPRWLVEIEADAVLHSGADPHQPKA
jgi:enamine deaminase RidA (YjgF/YER057c/UK114 family)